MKRSCVGILAIGLILTLAACGGGGDDAAGTTAAGGSSTTSSPTTTSLPATTTTTSVATTTHIDTTTTTLATTTSSDVPVLTIPPDVTLGTGDVQVTLIWDTDSDMDLRVEDPTGHEISHHQPASESGGTLDHDKIPGPGDMGPHVENIFWADGTAPAGTYSAYIQHYDANSANPSGTYTLEVRVAGELIHQETGRVPLYENSPRFEFTFGA